MKRVLVQTRSIGLVLLLLLSGNPLYADGTPEPPFKVKARSAVLINIDSSQIVFEQNPDIRIPPASLTKLMTMHLAFESVDNGYVALADRVPISKKAWKTGGSKMFLEVDTTVPLETLLRGIAVVSANDACVAVAEFISGVEEVFVEKMNKEAAAIGMTSTVFKNSHGLPHEEQNSTARDMALLACYYMRRHPDALKMHSIKEMTYNNITQRNRNGLLWLDYGVDGLKTGWFSRAGFHIIATAYRDGNRFAAVVLGAKGERQRENIALKLINFGFRNFKTIQVVSTDKPVAHAAVWKGAAGDVPLGVYQGVYITIPRETEGEIYVEKDFPEKIFAPVDQYQQVGHIRIMVDQKKLKTIPLVVLDAVERAGFITILLHGIALFFIAPPYWGAILMLVLLLMGSIFKIINSQKSRKKDNRSLLG